MLKNMKEQFIKCEQSLELKELGFDEPCLACWNSYTNLFEYASYSTLFKEKWAIGLPTFYQAFRWFRDKYGLIGLVEGGYDNGKNIFTYVIWNGSKDFFDFEYFSTYEEAELACLTELIKIAKQSGKE